LLSHDKELDRQKDSSQNLSTSSSFAVCCSVLQCVAVCCSVLQCFAVCCSALQCVAVRCSALQYVAVRCSMLQCVAVCCSALQCVTVRYNVLQRVAACCVWQYINFPIISCLKTPHVSLNPLIQVHNQHNQQIFLNFHKIHLENI